MATTTIRAMDLSAAHIGQPIEVRTRYTATRGQLLGIEPSVDVETSREWGKDAIVSVHVTGTVKLDFEDATVTADLYDEVTLRED